ALRLYHPLNVRPSSCTRVGRRPNTILVNVEPVAVFVDHLHQATPFVRDGIGDQVGCSTDHRFCCACFPCEGATVGGASGTPRSVFHRARGTKKGERDLLPPCSPRPG